MSSPQEPDHGFRLDKGELEQLLTQMVDKYTTQDSSLEFLAAMQFPRARIPIFRTATQFWREVLTEINRNADSGTLFRRLRTVALRRTDIDRTIAAIINGADPEARAVAEPRPDGCHVIVRTPNDRDRNSARLFLVSAGLDPAQVWANPEMTSYVVNDKSPRALDTRLRNLKPTLIYKVVPRGKPDYLLRHITVIGQDERELPMYEVPVQLTIRDLADLAVTRHPSARTALVGPVEDVVHRGVRLHPADTLVELDSIDVPRITFGSLKFGKIRVLCIGASPDGMPRVDVEQEATKITAKANPDRIELVEKLAHVSPAALSSVTRHRPDIIHLSCHGEGLDLILEDGDHGAFPMKAASFAQLLTQWQSLYHHTLSGIVLNSCSGERIGPALLDATRKVIAHERKLAGPQAEVFTENLYDELSRIPVLDAAALIAARPVYPDDSDGGGLLIFPPPPPGSR